MSQSATSAEPPNGRDGRDARWADHRRERRERILDTAIALIDREGVGVSVPTIAAAADIPRSVVYKLFKDRDDLDDQIRARIVDQMNEALAPTLVFKGSVRDIVRRSVDTYVRWVGEHGNLHRFLGTGSTDRHDQASKVVVGGKTAFAQDVRSVADAMLPLAVGERPSRGLTENLAYGLVGLVDSTVNRWLLADPKKRSSARNLSRFLTDAACAVIEATVASAGGELDLDQPVGAGA